MELLILIGVFVLWCFLFNLAREIHTNARGRRDDRVMVAYQHQEAARAHAEDLAGIDRAVRATSDEMIRVAAEAHDDVIEGTATEISPR